MKYTGNKIRAYQNGELIGHEIATYFSKELAFIAIHQLKDDETLSSESNIVEVRKDGEEILLSADFPYRFTITDAPDHDLASDLVIFHHGNIGDVMNYLTVKAIRNNLQQVNDLSRRLIYEDKKRAIENNKDSIKIKVTDESHSYQLLSNIPMWIRRIFKAV